MYISMTLLWPLLNSYLKETCGISDKNFVFYVSAGVYENRNSSPSRQKEANSGSAKSRGSTVQISLGYGPNTFEDSRRASSSVSQVRYFSFTFDTEAEFNIYYTGYSITKTKGNATKKRFPLVYYKPVPSFLKALKPLVSS